MCQECDGIGRVSSFAVGMPSCTAGDTDTGQQSDWQRMMVQLSAENDGATASRLQSDGANS